MKLHYFFPAGVYMVSGVMASAIFGMASGLVAQNSYDTVPLYTGECSYVLDAKSKSADIQCDKYKENKSLTSDTLWALIDKKTLQCSVVETFRKDNIFRCNTI